MFVLDPLFRMCEEGVVIKGEIERRGLVASSIKLGSWPDAVLVDSFDPFVIKLAHNLLTGFLHWWMGCG